MTLSQGAMLFFAGIGGGLINSVAGGGGFICFPALIFHGVPPIPASATQTVALWPGVAASSGAYWKRLRENRHLVLPLVIASLLGGAFGAFLLLVTPEARFTAIIPWLILGATLLFTFGGRLTERLRRRHFDEGAPSNRKIIFGSTLQFFSATYGGYLGAGNGMVMLAILAVMNVGNIHAMNALKSIMATSLNGAAIVTLTIAGAVYWPEALVMMTGAALGGYFGAWYAQRVNPDIVRWIVIAIGVVLTVYFFVRY